MSATAQRYTAVAIVLHWAIAFAILFMIPLGFWMHSQAEHGDISDSVFRAYQLHKSVGLTVLGLTLVRLAWRLMHPPPPFPEHMPAWERRVAELTHRGFYVLTIGLPLSGWLYVSTGWSIHDEQVLAVPTYYFGLFRVPHLFNFAVAGEEVRAATAEAAFAAHWIMAYATIALAGLHVLAALKHHWFDRDATLARMVPGLRAPFETEPPPKNGVRRAILGFGLGATALAAVAALYAAGDILARSGETAPQTQSSVELAELDAPDAGEPMLAAPAGVSAWNVDPRRSAITFAFTVHDAETGEDSRFEGRFTRWRADIRFDADNLEASAVAVVIDTASATDGVQVHDAWLPQEAWFDAANHPQATFRSDDIRRDGDGYEARGQLTIKGETRDVVLAFTLALSGDAASMSGRTAVDRRDFDIGEGTEADEMVSREVEIGVRVEATRAP